MTNEHKVDVKPLKEHAQKQCEMIQVEVNLTEQPTSFPKSKSN